MNFKIVKLGDIDINVIDGDRGKNYPHKNELLNSGYCLFLSAKNVTQNGFMFCNNQFITKEKDELLNNGKLKRGDIVITTRGTVGNVAIYSDDVPFNNIRINADMLIIRCGKNIDNYYLYQVLRSKLFYNQVFSIKSGTAQPQLPKSHFLKMTVPIPNIETQHKISAIMSGICDKIILNNRINRNLEEQAQAIFKSWFVDFEPFGYVMPDNWKITTLDSIADISTGKRPKNKLSEMTSEFCFPLVGATSVMGYTNEYNHNNKILVIGRVGTHGIVQRFNLPCWASDNTFVIKSKYYEFLYQVLQRINYKNMNCGSTQPLITQRDLKKVSVILPTENHLENFEKIAGNLMCKLDYNKRENEKLSALRDALLPQLLNGKIEIP
ncbi:MAG: restriction endonuclease subunit S [Ruminococcus sp.]|nr:restriction endonuclease subunit S [Ruminococcus sp.]